MIGLKIEENQERKNVTPRAWCLPNTISYNSKGLSKRQRKEGKISKTNKMWTKLQNKEHINLYYYIYGSGK